MHGGLFSNDDVTLDDIRTTERNKQPSDSGEETLWIFIFSNNFIKNDSYFCSCIVLGTCSFG